MAKHTRKKQRRQEEEEKPMGSAAYVDNDAEKDDEERRLESLLFGKEYRPENAKGKQREGVGTEEEDEGELDGSGNAEGALRDEDIFFIDDARSDNTGESSTLSASASEGTGSDDEGHTSDRRKNDETQVTATNPLKSIRKTKKAAWVDPDDATLSVSLATAPRLRKLRDSATEDIVGGTQYEARLRRAFEKINPTPAWAASARKKALALNSDEHRKRRRSGLESGSEEEGTGYDDVQIDMDALLTRTDGILRESRGRLLEKGVLGIERLRDANISAQAEGEIKALAFHPLPRVPVLMTASTDRRVRLFTVDGHTNPHMHTVHIPALPITSASFHPSGNSILLTGPRPFYYTLDLQSGQTTRSPRGLWGSVSAGAVHADLGMETCAFDPSGSVLAVAGRRGYVHLVDWRAGGAAQVVGSVKMNSGVRALWWSRQPGADGFHSELLTLGADAEMYVWDVGERRCIRKWKEEGGYGATVMSGDKHGKYLAVGSKSGLVNVYDDDAFGSSFIGTPTVKKTLQNLTTSISTLCFNHDSQLAAMASNAKKDQMRLVHLPSLTTYSNWPTSSTPLGHVTSVDFSPTGKYIAIGNNRGRALLYQLSHYASLR